MAKLTFELHGKTADVLHDMIEKYGQGVIEILATDISHAILQLQLELLADELEEVAQELSQKRQR